MQEILRLIEQQSGAVDSDIIKDLIKKHRARHVRMQELYEEYKGEVPILDRKMPDSMKVNNKLANDYRGDIIDTATGYLFGRPVSYGLDNTNYSNTEYERYNQELQSFLLRNNASDLDATTGKKAIICGYGARLAYIDRNGQERVMDVDPWECIFIEDGSTSQIQYAMRYYDYDIIQNGKDKTVTKVEWYDAENIYFYIQNGDKFIPDNITEENAEKPHLFDRVPLIKFSNNDEDMGDTERVSSLIDAYDSLLSDVQNEVEEFRLAYMIFKGVEPDATTIAAARATGAFGIDQTDDISFLTKQMQTDFIDAQKKTLNDNIYKFAKTVDMQSDNFSGASESGESRKWKLLGLENKCIIKERKFTTGLRKMFEVVQTAWDKKGIRINYLDIYWTFGRNLPIELTTEAKVNKELLGTVSEKTRLSLLSFVDDVDWEINQMQGEITTDLDTVELDD